VTQFQCETCGHQNIAEADSCKGCGKSLSRHCAQCSISLPAGARFCPQCGTPVDKPAAPSTNQPEGERRRLTVLFCDLVGSTAIAARLDPEDWRDTLLRFQEAAIGVIERAGGYVAQHLGDGLLVYFGYPRALEDDTERALRCGIELIRTTHALNPDLRAELGVELDLRVGVHAGPVVVSEVGGERKETLALGNTANVAARVQAQAEPGSMLVSAATLRGVERAFVVRDKGLHALKGIEQPVHLYAVLRPSAASDRFDFAGEQITQFVGRAEELDTLRARVADAAAGRGQVVGISGEPGMGKSRLVHRFRQLLEPADSHWLVCRAAAYNRDSPLRPWLQLQRELIGIDDSMADAERLRRLEQAVMASGMATTDAVPLFAAAHGVALSPDYVLPALSPLGLRKRTLALLADWFAGLGRQPRPVTLLIEDLHWLDPSSLELLGQILERSRDARMLILLTYRPEFAPPWPSSAAMTTLALTRLAPDEVEELIASSVPPEALAPGTIDRIVSRAEGVPFFAEELARALAESGSSVDPGGAPVVPATLEDSLMARLETIAEVKRVAQLAAVVGRECSESLLGLLWEGELSTLHAGLRAAEEARVLVRHDASEGPVYVFRHALLRDAAYNSMLRRTRRQHHHAVARQLGDRFPAVVREQPELLAHHLTMAGQEDAAIDAWFRAGTQALQRAAFQEAIRHLQQARALLASHSGDARALDVVQTLAGALVFERGWANEETREAWQAAQALCDPEAEPLRAGAIACGLGDHYVDAGDLASCLHQFEGVIEAGQRSNLPLLVIAGHLGAAMPLRYLGRYPEARAHIDAALAVYDPQQHRFLEAGFQEEKGISLLAWSAWLNWDVGAVERAREDVRRGLELAHAFGNPFAAALVGAWGASMEVFSCNWAQAITLGERAAKLAADHGFVMLEAMARLSELAGRSVAQNMTEARDLFRMELGRMAATGNRLGASEILGVLAMLELEKGQPAEALAAIEGGLGLAAAMGQPWCDAWLLTLKAQALLAMSVGNSEPAPAEAEALLRRAVTLAHSQGARSYELRAATALTRLLLDLGQRNAGEQTLRSALSAFDSSLDSVELAQSRALLATLQ